MAYALLAIFISNHALSSALRTVHAIMAEGVSHDIALSAAEIGLFAGAYNVSFAMMQLPIGVALDRYGPRLTCAVGAGIVGIGAALSAMAPNLSGLLVAQTIVGIGCAPALMGGFVFASAWFARERFSAISSVMISLGSIGVILTATPLALLLELVGWRGAFWCFAVAAFVMAAILYLLTRDTPPGTTKPEAKAETVWQNATGIAHMLLDYRLLGLLIVGLMAYPIKLTLRSVWVGPYFTDIYGLDLITVGNIALIVSLAVVIGPSFAPMLQKLLKRSGVISLAVIIGGGCLVALAGVSGQSWALDMILISVAILILGCYVLIYASARDRFPEKYTGRALATINFSIFVGAALWQIGSGALLNAIAPDPTHPDLASYDIMYLLMGGFSIITGFIYLLTRPKKRDTGKNKDSQPIT